MKTIYLDSNFMCHIANSGTMTEVQTEAFDDLCNNAIELMRFVPEGSTWTRPDGRIIYGEFIQATDSARIDAYQWQWMEDQERITDMQNALNILGVTDE